jgi:predicted dinucleotide-binding enzyme
MAVSSKNKPPVISLKTRIGWIGTGVMGLSMCNHLLTKGYKVKTYSRTKAKAQPLLDSGATWAESSMAVAEQSDAIFTMVGFPEDVREVYLGESGILTTAKPGSIVIDMTTTSPSLAQTLRCREAMWGHATARSLSWSVEARMLLRPSSRYWKPWESRSSTRVDLALDSMPKCATRSL